MCVTLWVGAYVCRGSRKGGVGQRVVGSLVVVEGGIIQYMVAFSGCCLSQDACWTE